MYTYTPRLGNEESVSAYDDGERYWGRGGTNGFVEYFIVSRGVS